MSRTTFGNIGKIFLAALTFSTALSGKEVDSFTRRKEILTGPEKSPNGREILNVITNKLIGVALQKANEQGGACNVRTMTQLMKDHLAGKKFLNVEASYGAMEEIVDHGVSEHSPIPLLSLHLEKKDSVYSDYRNTEATFLKSVANIIRHKDYVVGADKFGHFFGQGFSYHNVKKKKGLAAAFVFGDGAEKGNMGWGVTGVYSYGDLAANYGGMLFWDRLLERQGDKEPYVLCEKGKWVANPKTSFDWNEYITPAWDEGLNCNVYRNQTLASKVALRVLQLEKEQNTKLYCPISADKCQEMIAYYGDHARHLVNPSCFSASAIPSLKEVQQDLRCSKRIGRKTSDTLGYMNYFFNGTVKEMLRSLKHGAEKKVLRTLGKGEY